MPNDSVKLQPKQYHIEGVLGVTKSALKRTIWRQAEGSENARTAIALLESRKTGFFSLVELGSLVDWLVWDDAAANGETDATSGLTRYREARCRRRHANAMSKLAELGSQGDQRHDAT